MGAKTRIKGRKHEFWDENKIIGIFVPVNLGLMKTLARTFYKIQPTVMFFTVVPVFYFLFVLAYNPFGISDFLSAGQGRYTLNLIICTLIVLGVMVVSRILLYLLRRLLDLNWSLYILWCTGEVVVIGLFMSIPMGIGWAGVHTYFTTMSLCVLYTAGILVFPLSILTMAVQLYVLGKQARLAPVTDERTLVRFYDEQKRLKIVLSSEAILYIESEDNYVHITYLDNGRIKEYTLRSSMRALEEAMERHGLVRCHRSFFLNPAHVELVRKDAVGFALAQLDREEVKQIPVSKRYYDSLTALL